VPSRRRLRRGSARRSRSRTSATRQRDLLSGQCPTSMADNASFGGPWIAVRSPVVFRFAVAILCVVLTLLALGTAWITLVGFIDEIRAGELFVSISKSRTSHEYLWSHIFAWRTEPVGFFLNAAGLLALPIMMVAIALIFAIGVWASWMEIAFDARRSALPVRVARVLFAIFAPMWFLLFFGLPALYASHLLPVVAPTPACCDASGARGVGTAPVASSSSAGTAARISARKAAHSAQSESTADACSPHYPAEASKAGAAGLTLIRLLIDANGQLLDVELLHSAGSSKEHRLLDDEALRVTHSCHYSPGRDAQGRPVASTVDREFSWRLE